ncbi:hypothetical protein [Streptomyces sp. NPDC058401]|uniref:hypothetical protein n=1 Tax=Streptomyces sp. NPDC058401 TaxID=3346480 RepID=UPI00365CE011
MNLATGTVAPGPRWDTGVAQHLGGGLAMMLSSDQGATLGLFARTDPDAATAEPAAPASPVTMRMQRRALILDADGYETPVFSPDGRHFAIQGNAYEYSLGVFAFPSLRSVPATTLGEYGRPDTWSRHTIAFGARPGVLLTDGSRTWEADELAEVTTATAEDPMWLRLQAAVNSVSGRDG